MLLAQELELKFVAQTTGSYMYKCIMSQNKVVEHRNIKSLVEKTVPMYLVVIGK